MQDLHITLCQSNIIWEQAEANRKHLNQLLEKLGSDETDIIIFPEMFTTGFTMASESLAEETLGLTQEWMKSLAIQKNAAVTGSLIIKDESTYRNRLLWVDPQSENPQFYDKKHLFTLAGEENHYVAGHKKLNISYKSWKIGVFICYDLRFPVWCRNTDGLDLLIFVANFPEKRQQAWNTLLPARAIENQCFVAGVNRIGSDGNGIYYSGDSAVFDFEGSKIADLKNQEQHQTIKLDHHSLQVYKRAYPFLKDDDLFHID